MGRGGWWDQRRVGGEMVGNDEGGKGRGGIRKMVERKVVGGEGREGKDGKP